MDLHIFANILQDTYDGVLKFILATFYRVHMVPLLVLNGGSIAYIKRNTSFSEESMESYDYKKIFSIHMRATLQSEVVGDSIRCFMSSRDVQKALLPIHP